MSYLFTSESVFAGHPDKVCDQVSDAILDYVLQLDPDARVACECTISPGLFHVMGEITAKTEQSIPYQEIARETLRFIGYDNDEAGFNCDTCSYIINVVNQSPDIAAGVDRDGAGDQGMMFGYATNETENYMPIAQQLANNISVIMFSKYKNDLLPWALPDGKCQITVQYDDNGNFEGVDTIVVSAQHKDKYSIKEITPDITNICNIALQGYAIKKDCKFYINPTGKFVKGGPAADTGLTGRKIVVDTYGGYAPHGGGCVNGDTEFLTLNGWKKISEFSSDDKVAQWDDGKISFVNGEFVRLPKTKMYHIATNKSLDMVLSDNHNVLYKTSKGNYQKKTCQEILDYYYKNNGFRSVQIPIYFTYDFKDNPGLDLTDDKIRLQVAFCADGTILKENSGWTGRIRVKKEYKKEALRELFASTGLDYKETPDKDCSIFWCKPPFVNKKMNECLSKCNLHQAQVIADEVIKWDGDRDCVFRTTHKDEADFIQFIFMAIYGTSSHFSIDDRVGETFSENYTRKSVCYEVRQGKYKYSTPFRTSGSSIANLTIEDYEDNDPWMYCINVPSHNLVLRYNNRVFITGNCFSGKDSSKVDRSGAYMARYVAKNLVASGVCDKCMIQVAYIIGQTEPASIDINCFGTEKKPIAKILEAVNQTFDFAPRSIIHKFDLKHTRYLPYACFGHFGRIECNSPWEQLDKVEELKTIFDFKKEN